MCGMETNSISKDIPIILQENFSVCSKKCLDAFFKLKETCDKCLYRRKRIVGLGVTFSECELWCYNLLLKKNVDNIRNCIFTGGLKEKEI
jgi:hypothetical protein